MSTLTETITYGPFIAPAGTAVAGVVITATDGNGNHIGTTVAPDTQVATLTLTPGTWTVAAQAVDSGGNAVGPVAVDSQTYTVVAQTVTVSVPVGLSGSNA